MKSPIPAPAVQVEQSDAPILTNAEIRKLMHRSSRFMGGDTYSDTEFACLQDVVSFARAVEAKVRAALAGRAPVSGTPLPTLADDDDVAFPNDTGLAVIHAERYWNLRGCEDVCAALGAKPVSGAPKLQPQQMFAIAEKILFSHTLDEGPEALLIRSPAELAQLVAAINGATA